MLNGAPCYPGAHLCKVTFKHLPQPLISHTQSFGNLKVFWWCNPNIYVNKDPMQNFKPLGQTLPAFLEKSNWIRKREKHAGDELCQAQAQLETHIKEQRTIFFWLESFYFC